MAYDLFQMQEECMEVMRKVEGVVGNQGWGGVIESWNRRREQYFRLFEKRKKR